MGKFSKLNKSGAVVREGINTRDYQFKPLKDFIGRDIPVDGYFFTHGRYGKQVVVVGLGTNINMPARALEQFEAIDADEDLKDAVLRGELVLTGIKDLPEYKTTAYELTDK